MKGHLSLKKKDDKLRYQDIRNRPVIPCKYIHDATMSTLKIKDFVLNLVTNIGWKPYFDIKLPSYIELVREFYATYEFTKV